MAVGGGNPQAVPRGGRGGTQGHSAAPCCSAGAQLIKLNISPTRGATFWCCSNPADLYQTYSNVHLPHAHRHTCKRNYKKLSFGENAVLCRLQIHKPPFSSLLPRCPSDQRETQSFREYSFSFCRSAFLPTPKLISAQVVFPFIAQPSLWKS